MSDKYILDGRNAIPADLMTWAKWFESADRHVANDDVSGHRVSTVFLGLDHQYGDGPPLIFETMVFGPDGKDVWCERASPWEQAEAKHAEACCYVRSLNKVK